MTISGVLQEQLQPILDEFVRDIAQTSGLTLRSGSNCNDSFLLRSYVEGASASGGEVAITVNVRIGDNVLHIDTEICRDDGRVLKEGPILTMAVGDEKQVLEHFRRWADQLRDYLVVNRQFFIGLLRT